MSAALAVAAVRWEDPEERRAAAAGAEVRVEPTDADLLTRTGRDAETAFAGIVHRHGRPLYAVAYRALASPADAEEVVQDAFVLLWRKRSGVRLVGDSALPWLIVAVKHLAANRRRAHLRRSAHERQAAVEPVAIDLGLERGEVADLLVRAFAALPERDAAVARLCLVEDVTYAEAAARLGTTEGAVRNRLSRARARLRRDLEDGR